MDGMIVFSAIVFLSSAFSTVVGFGAVTLGIPLLSLVMDVRSAVAIMTVAALFLLLSKAWIFRKEIDYKIGKQLALPSIPGAIIGAYLLGVVDAFWIKKALGLFVLLYVLLSLRGALDKVRIGRKMTALASFIYGLSSGIIGSGELISAPLLLSLGLRRGRFIGTFSFVALAIMPFKIILYMQSGILNHSQTSTLLILTLASIAGVLAGRKLIDYVQAEMFKKIVLATLFVISLMLLAN
ncbi:MAG: sulfite exporter TauE/SafE family protein [Candidatus Altiarchaeota archaeon]